MTGDGSQITGEAAGSRADFEDDIDRAEFGVANDQLDEVDINEEVLSQVAARVQPLPLEQGYQVRSRLTLGVSH